MILLVLALLIALFGFWLYLCFEYEYSWDKWWQNFCSEGLAFFSGTITALICVVFCAILIGTIINRVTANATYQENKQTYEALIYKANTQSVRDELGLLNKEYVDEIQIWNVNYSKYKANSENIWIGVMYPKKCIEGMDVIDLNSFKNGGVE